MANSHDYNNQLSDLTVRGRKDPPRPRRVDGGDRTATVTKVGREYVTAKLTLVGRTMCLSTTNLAKDIREW